MKRQQLRRATFVLASSIVFSLLSTGAVSASTSKSLVEPSLFLSRVALQTRTQISSMTELTSAQKSYLGSIQNATIMPGGTRQGDILALAQDMCVRLSSGADVSSVTAAAMSHTSLVRVLNGVRGATSQLEYWTNAVAAVALEKSMSMLGTENYACPETKAQASLLFIEFSEYFDSAIMAAGSVVDPNIRQLPTDKQIGAEGFVFKRKFDEEKKAAPNDGWTREVSTSTQVNATGQKPCNTFFGRNESIATAIWYLPNHILDYIFTNRDVRSNSKCEPHEHGSNGWILTPIILYMASLVISYRRKGVTS